LVKRKTIDPSFNTDIDLSKREIEILKLICDEFTNSEIAKKLLLSIRTVEGYRESLMEKTGVRNIAGLVVYALKNDLMELELSI
ncbi:MAG: helix-turn-helix transcriptional regulator, partial [Bacteroidota bacterium]